MAWELIVNPLTKRVIRKGSVLHMKLIKQGVVGIDGEDLTQQKPEEIEEVARVIDKRKVVKYRIKKL